MNVAVQHLVVDLTITRPTALLFRLDAFDGLPDDAAVEQSALGFGFRELWHGVALRCFAARVASFAALAWRHSGVSRPHDANGWKLMQ